LGGTIHGLDARTGEEKWRVTPNPHPFAAIFGNGTMVGRYVAFGTSSFELFAPLLLPDYPGFTFRGSVVLLDPADGSIVWQTHLVPEPTLQPGGEFGPSGASVWGAPAFDRASNTLFVGTSNNYSLPTTDTSDALIALDAGTGEIKWVSQKTAGDHWNIRFLPEDPSDPPDFDFGDSPQVYKLDGRTVVAAGQKSGFFHVVDAATGAEVATPQQFVPGGHLGGFHIESAFAEGVNYANGNYWNDPFSGNPPDGGAVFAISGDGQQELWSFTTAAPILAGITVANGVVYAQSIDGQFYAVRADNGQELARLSTGGESGAPVVSRGRIYLGTGNVLAAVLNPLFVPGPAAIIALGVGDSADGEIVQGEDEGTPEAAGDGLSRALLPSAAAPSAFGDSAEIRDADDDELFEAGIVPLWA
jgi:polyvinyl alcohol dehydrogenase (cytochrome)